MPVSRQLLRQFPLLQPLAEQALDQLSAGMRLRSYARRETVVSKDDKNSFLGFLVDGRLQGLDFTVDGRGVGLFFVDPSDYFGELSVIDNQAPSEYVVAATKSTVAALDATQARELVINSPAIAQAVMLRMAQRTRAAMAQRTLLALPTPFQRLCAMLLTLWRQQPSDTALIVNVPTHQELAIMINASRETVTRAFQVLFFQKDLARVGNDLHVLQAANLKAYAEGRSSPMKS